MAVRSNGTVVAWGRTCNGSGFVPIVVLSGLSNAGAVAAGIYHQVALRADGSCAFDAYLEVVLLDDPSNVRESNDNGSGGGSNAQVTHAVGSGRAANVLVRVRSNGNLGIAGACRLVVDQPPVVSGFSPASSSVETIVGANLNTFTSVRFGDTEVTNYLDANETNLVVKVPAGALSGPITVESPAGTATSANSFLVLQEPLVAGAPVYERSGGAFGSRVAGSAGLPVVIESATNLVSPVFWTPVVTNAALVPGWRYAIQNSGSLVQRFFCVKQP